MLFLLWDIPVCTTVGWQWYRGASLDSHYMLTGSKSRYRTYIHGLDDTDAVKCVALHNHIDCESKRRVMFNLFEPESLNLRRHIF